SKRKYRKEESANSIQFQGLANSAPHNSESKKALTSVPASGEQALFATGSSSENFPGPFRDTESAIGNELVYDTSMAKVAPMETVHTLSPWPLSNGTGFETMELPYVHFFMTQMTKYLWFPGISQPCANLILPKAMNQPGLHHAMLA